MCTLLNHNNYFGHESSTYNSPPPQNHTDMIIITGINDSFKLSEISDYP